MAGIEFNNITPIPTNRATEVSSNAPAQESIRRTSDTTTTSQDAIRETENEDRQKAMQEAAEAREAALENVVSRSEDGDTVQVSEDGATELAESAEGSVVAGTEEENNTRAEMGNNTRAEADFSVENETAEAAQTATGTTEAGAVAAEAAEVDTDRVAEAAEKAAEVLAEQTVAMQAAAEAAAERAADAMTAAVDEGNADTQAVNGPPYTGYTEQQLETFYIQGSITRSEYTTEESRREAIREQVQGENAAVNEDMARVNAAGQRTEQVNFAIENALNSDSEIDIETRLNAVSDRTTNQARMTEEAGRLWDYQLRA